MIEKDLGFVVRRYNFRESSLIATLYTSRFGKIRGILKGFYTGKREFSSPFDLFSFNEFVFYPKKSEIWLISHVDLVSDFRFLRENIFKSRACAALFKLVDKTMPLWDKNIYIFNLLLHCLDSLKEVNEFKTLYICLIKFLTFSGFKPEFNHCIRCKNILSEDILFSVSKGGLVCRKCYPQIKDAQKLSKQASRSLLYIQKTDFPLLGRLNPTPDCEREIFYILRKFLSYHLDFNDLLNIDDYRPKQVTFSANFIKI